MSKTPTDEMVEAGAKAAWEVREKRSGGTLTWEGVLRRRKECQFTYMNACDVRDQVRAALTAALQSAAEAPPPADPDALFWRLRIAYQRGAEWYRQNGSMEFLDKASYDYADKITSPVREDRL